MEYENQSFIFTINEQHYALPLSVVERVVWAVELLSVPKAPDILQGLINIKGEIIPVMNIRKILHLPERKMDINDRIVFSRTSAREVAFIVDKVEGVVALSPAGMDNARQNFPEMEHFLEGIGRFKDNTVFIYNVDKLFSNQNLMAS